MLDKLLLRQSSLREHRFAFLGDKQDSRDAPYPEDGSQFLFLIYIDFIDDKIERGCTLKAANTLISERGGKIVACICIGNTYGTDKIDSIPVYSLL